MEEKTHEALKRILKFVRGETRELKNNDIVAIENWTDKVAKDYGENKAYIGYCEELKREVVKINGICMHNSHAKTPEEEAILDKKDVDALRAKGHINEDLPL